MVCIVNQRTGLCVIQLLLKGNSGEISGFNEEILIYLSESCVFYNIKICTQFCNLQQLLPLYDCYL